METVEWINWVQFLFFSAFGTLAAPFLHLILLSSIFSCKHYYRWRQAFVIIFQEARIPYTSCNMMIHNVFFFPFYSFATSFLFANTLLSRNWRLAKSSKSLSICAALSVNFVEDFISFILFWSDGESTMLKYFIPIFSFHSLILEDLKLIGFRAKRGKKKTTASFS